MPSITLATEGRRGVREGRESTICQVSPAGCPLLGLRQAWGGGSDHSCPQEPLSSCVQHSQTRQRHSNWKLGFLVSWLMAIRRHLILDHKVWLPGVSLMGKQYVI